MPRPTPRLIASLAAVLAASSWAAAGEADDAVSAARRYGQASAVATHCPGGKVTAAGEALKAKHGGKPEFDAEVARIKDEWAKALGCQEADPETGRMNERCRKLKRLSCAEAWTEIGPEGRVLPGLIELAP